MRSRCRPSIRTIAVVLMVGLASPGFGQDRASAEKVLSDLGVATTREGLTKFLDAVARGEHGPLSPADADRFIAWLGSDDFETREKATASMAKMILPPVEKLTLAATQKDPEVALRANRILAQLSQRTDPIAALFETIRARGLKLTSSQIRPLLTRCENPPALESTLEALVAVVTQDDLKQVRDSLDDKDWRVKAAAIRCLGAILKGKAVAELETHLTSPEARVRSAAARALVDLGAALDYKKYAAELDPESRVLILRVAEKRFRQENQDKRDKPEVQTQYESLLIDYAEALAKVKNVKHEKKGPQNTTYWIELGMDTSKNPEVLLYRIQWFSGAWSSWFVPGFNDREVGKGRDIRFWACFNDHSYEMITTSDKTKYREVKDLP